MLNFCSNEKKSVTGSSIKDVNLKYVGFRKDKSYIYNIDIHLHIILTKISATCIQALLNNFDLFGLSGSNLSVNFMFFFIYCCNMHSFLD